MKLTIGIITGVIIFGFTILFITNVSKTTQNNNEVEKKVSITKEEQIIKKGDKVFDFDETEYDFGIIKQSGSIVQHTFPFTYNGEETITVTGILTSCACASAEIDKKIISKGDMATITVSFDPNLHSEPEGKFFKSITLSTDPEITDIPELKIWAEIDLDLGPEAYKLKTHND